MPIGPAIRILVKNIILSAFNVEKAIEPILAKVQQSCPPKADIEKFIKQKNNSVKGLNEIKKTLKSVSDTSNTITNLIKALDVAVKVAKFIPFPPFVPGNKIADILIGAQKIVENAKSTLKGIPEVTKIITDIVIQIIEKIQQLETALQNCLIKDAKKELAFNPKKAYKKGDVVIKSKNPPSKIKRDTQRLEETNEERNLNPQSGGISKNSEINNFKTDNSNIGGDGSNNASIGDEIDPNTGKIINEENIDTGTGIGDTGIGDAGTGGTGTENTDINKPNITLSKQNQINSPKIITENTKVIQDLNSLGIDTTNLIPNLNNAILNLINSPIGTQGVINEDGTFSITNTGTGDEDNETNILVSTEPNTDKTLIEKTSINQNLEGTGISITISNLPLQIEDKYYKALEDNIDKDPEDPNNSKIWEEITEEEALEIYFDNLGLIETPNDVLSTTENGDINLDSNKILEDSLKPGAISPFKYKDFIFILENDKENKLSVPRRRIVATRETDRARIEGDYSFSATTQILVDETKFLVDRFLDDGLNLIYNKVDIRLKETRDLIS